MTKRNNYNESEVREILDRFDNLSEEGQKEVVKSVIEDKLLTSYILNSSFTGSHLFVLDDSSNSVTKEATKICNTFDELIKTIYSEDIELRNRIVKKFLENYKKTVKELKKEICGSEHQYSKWSTKKNSKGEYFERKCAYCGTVQKAYSKKQKRVLEYGNKYIYEELYVKEKKI